MIIQPDSSLFRPIRIVVVQHDLSQSQPIRLEQSHDPAKHHESEDVHEGVVVRRLGLRQTRHRLDLRHTSVWSESVNYAAVDVRQKACTVDLHGSGKARTLDLLF